MNVSGDLVSLKSDLLQLLMTFFGRDMLTLVFLQSTLGSTSAPPNTLSPMASTPFGTGSMIGPGILLAGSLEELSTLA